MNWEALSAISAAITAIVILITVIYAAKQVTVLNEQSKSLAAQLEHLRLATQLNGTLAVFEELMSPDFLEPYRFVLNDFEELMKDPGFRSEASLRAPDTATHKERQLMRHMERIGALVENNLLDSEVILNFSADVIVQTWTRLKPLVLEHRRVSGADSMWAAFELLAERASANLAPKRTD